MVRRTNWKRQEITDLRFQISEKKARESDVRGDSARIGRVTDALNRFLAGHFVSALRFSAAACPGRASALVQA